jgi:hypothetical protein
MRFSISNEHGLSVSIYQKRQGEKSERTITLIPHEAREDFYSLKWEEENRRGIHDIAVYFSPEELIEFLQQIGNILKDNLVIIDNDDPEFYKKIALRSKLYEAINSMLDPVQ